MKLSNPYLRAVIVGAVFFVAVVLQSVARRGWNWQEIPGLVVLTLAVAGIASTLLTCAFAAKWKAAGRWFLLIPIHLLGWFAAMGVMLATVKSAAPAVPQVPAFASANEMMAYMAEEAVKWVRRDAGVQLDYSLESIREIEGRLGALEQKIGGKEPPPGTFGNALGYGAYVGEVLRRRYGGSWDTNHPVAGEKTFPLALQSSNVVFPVGWCWKRMVNGEEDNILMKVQMLTNQPAL